MCAIVMSCIKYPHTPVHTPPPPHTHTRACIHLVRFVVPSCSAAAAAWLCAGRSSWVSISISISVWPGFLLESSLGAACERLWGPLCVIIQNPVNNTKRDANLLWRVRRGVAREGASRTLCKYFKRTVTITAHPLTAPSPLLGICVCVCVCALWRFSILSLLLALHFLQLLKIHTQIFRQHSHCPLTPIPDVLLLLSCLFPLAIPIRVALPLPHLVRFVCKLVYWNFLFAFCPVSSFASLPFLLGVALCHPLFGAVFDAFITWLHFGFIAYVSTCPHIKSFSLFDLRFKDF